MHIPRRTQGALFALALCFAAVAPRAHADDASRRAKAEEMLRLTQAAPAMQQQLGQLETQVNGLAKKQFDGMTLNPAQTKLSEEYLAQVHTIVADEVGWDKLHPLVTQSYADSFTEPELDGILAFYKTPAGQAMITKTPELVGKTNTLVRTHIEAMQPKLQVITESYVTKIKAADPASAAAKPAAPPTLTAPATKAAPAPKK